MTATLTHAEHARNTNATQASRQRTQERITDYHNARNWGFTTPQALTYAGWGAAAAERHFHTIGDTDNAARCRAARTNAPTHTAEHHTCNDCGKRIHPRATRCRPCDTAMRHARTTIRAWTHEETAA